MLAAASDHTASSARSKIVEEDLSYIFAALNISGKSDDKGLETMSLPKPTVDFQNNTNLKHNSISLLSLDHHCKLDKTFEFDDMISEVTSSAVTFLRSKTEHQKEYFELQKQALYFIVKNLNKYLSEKNVMGISNPPRMLSHVKQDNTKIQFFSDIFSSRIQNIINRNITSEALKNEIKLNSTNACRKHPRSMKVSNHGSNSQKLNSSTTLVSSKERSLATTSDVTSGECGLNRQLTLQWVFAKNVDFDDISQNLNQTWTSEDIKVLLPVTWNIVVSSNILTITDDRNQNIRMFFRNTLNIDVDYEDSCTPPVKSVKSSNIFENNRDVPNIQIKNMKFPYGKTSVPAKELCKNKCFHDSVNTKNVPKDKTCLLPLEEPLLLKYAEGKRAKQVLMYKDHSLRALTDKASNQKCYKTIESLLTASVLYEGDNINLIFDPLKVINRLKRERRVGSCLVRMHSSEAKHDLITEYSSLQNPCDYSGAQSRNKSITEKNTFVSTGQKSNVACSAVEKCQNKVFNPSTNTEKGNFFQKTNFTQQKRYSSALINNDEHLTCNERKCQEKPKLKIRRRKKSRTSYKRVNVKKIVSSVFREFFHFYSLLGGNLRSGSVITKSNSNYWLRVSGVVTDSCTLQLAGDLFTAVAGTKVVLNIYDYLKFLIAFARRKRMIVAELVKQMMVCESPIPLSALKNQWSTTRMKNQSHKSTYVCERDLEIHLECSQSLPDLRRF